MKNVFCIDGNIGAGKTTLLNNLKRNYPDEVDVITEPVELWSSFGGEGQDSLIARFYGNPMKYAFQFQMMVYFTFIKDAIDKIRMSNKPIIIMERCPLSSYHVFAKLLREDGLMTEMEGLILDSAYDLYSRCLNIDNTNIKHYFYLDVEPERCLDRIDTRRREGEDNIDVVYLTKLETKFKEFFSETRADVTYIDCTPSRLDQNYYYQVESKLMKTLRDLTPSE
jgi:deoxyadenosine/deoxycytidine kinase